MSLSVSLSKLVGYGLLKKSFSSIGNITVRHSSLWEPDYLILAKTKTPEYDLINFQLKGYDFVVLENYQKFLHKIARCLKINVSDCWVTPPQDLKILNFKPKSSIVDYDYKLKLFERNVQVVDVKSHVMPLFIEAAVTACPPGVKLSVHEHTPDMDEQRYVPDYQVIEKEKELEALIYKRDK